jgi:hypothetical protein
MQILTDGSGNPIWLYTVSDAEQGISSLSIAIGAVNQPYAGNQDSGNVTPGYYWVPLPFQTPKTVALASWTDWLEWDVSNQQLWWGKDITIQFSGDNNFPSVPFYEFYYQEF